MNYMPINICRALSSYITGTADCPYYAKAELLGDTLADNLPNFNLHKIVIQPNEWEVRIHRSSILERLFDILVAFLSNKDINAISLPFSLLNHFFFQLDLA